MATPRKGRNALKRSPQPTKKQVAALTTTDTALSHAHSASPPTTANQMTPFEQSQRKLLIVQTAIFFLTMLAATVVGFLQVGIASRQTELLEASFRTTITPSISVEINGSQLIIKNAGSTTITVTRIDTDLVDGVFRPREMITPGTAVSYSAEIIIAALKSLGKEFGTFRLSVFLNASNGDEYVAKIEVLHFPNVPSPKTFCIVSSMEKVLSTE
jgi:hypothetical protein